MERIYNSRFPPFFYFLGLFLFLGTSTETGACLRCINFHNNLCRVGNKGASLLKVKILKENVLTNEDYKKHYGQISNDTESQWRSDGGDTVVQQSSTQQQVTSKPAFQTLHQTFLTLTTALEKKDTATVPTYLNEYLGYYYPVLTNTIVKVLDVYRGDFSLKFSTINVWRWKDVSEIGQEFFTIVINDSINRTRRDIYKLGGSCNAPWIKDPFPRKSKGDELMKMMIHTCKQCRKRELECAANWSTDTSLLKNLLCTSETILKVKVLKKILLKGPRNYRNPFKYKDWNNKSPDGFRVTHKSSSTFTYFSKRDLELVQENFDYDKDKIWGGVVAAKAQVIDVYKGSLALRNSVIYVHSDEFFIGANMEDKKKYILAGQMVDEENLMVKYSEHNGVLTRLENLGRIEKQEALITQHLRGCDCKVQLKCANDGEREPGGPGSAVTVCADEQVACTHKNPGFCEENLACSRNVTTGKCDWKAFDRPNLSDEYGKCLKILYGKKWKENAAIEAL